MLTNKMIQVFKIFRYSGKAANCFKRIIVPSESKRTFFNGKYIGMDKFTADRNNIRTKLQDKKEIFMSQIHYDLKNNQRLFGEDLQTMVYFTDTKKDIELLKILYKKYSEKYGQNKYGALIMRLAVHIESDAIMNWLYDKQLIPHFTYVSCITIVMDHLYKKGKYQEIIKLFEFIKRNYNFNDKLPDEFVLFYTASCSRLNKKDAFTRCLYFFLHSPFFPSHENGRSLSILLEMCLRFNQPKTVIQLIEKNLSLDFPSITNSLLLLAYSRIQLWPQIFETFENDLKLFNPDPKYYKNTIKKAEKILSNTRNREDMKRYKMLVQRMYKSNLINSNTTLENALWTTVYIPFERQVHSLKRSTAQ